MTDLIEALRLQGWNDAADRIEELERQLDTMQDRLDTANKARADANFRANEKQFKLAEAVEIGNKMAASIMVKHYIVSVAADWEDMVAELEKTE